MINITNPSLDYNRLFFLGVRLLIVTSGFILITILLWHIGQWQLIIADEYNLMQQQYLQKTEFSVWFPAFPDLQTNIAVQLDTRHPTAHSCTQYKHQCQRPQVSIWTREFKGQLSVLYI